MLERVDFSEIPRDPRAIRFSGGQLNLYERLIQYFSVVAEARGTYLDLVNFNREIFPEVISLQESERLFEPEHGYGSPDASPELGDLIRHAETTRARRFLAATDDVRAFALDSAGAGMGAGATGVMNCLVPSIREFFGASDSHRTPRMVVTLPQYSVYDGIVTEHGVEPVYIWATRGNSFLPVIDDLEDVIKSRPMAIILTFPSNPAQTTYAGELIRELKCIVNLCIENEVFVIADNVYQDTLWRHPVPNPEILALGGPEWIVKVSSTSKDRPAHSGLRIGYWCGDRRLQERYCYYSSIQYNTPNSSSRCLFALDLLFRTLRIERRSLVAADLELLGNHVAGWGRPLDRARLHDDLDARKTEARYCERLSRIEASQYDANRTLIDTVRSLPAFADVVNDGIGNVLLIRVHPEVFGGNDHELFIKLLRDEQIGILPANAFGFPLERKNAWFRMTTIHEPIDVICSRLARVSGGLLR
jgi:aspartate/methionine/tyrosine aminotransferase